MHSAKRRFSGSLAKVAPERQMAKTASPMNRNLRGWLARGPFAIAASTLQGGMNFLIVLFLTYRYGLEDTGEYRMLFSWYSLFALASLLESNKVFIRHIVEEDRDSLTAVFFSRFPFSLGAFLLGAAGWLTGSLTGWFEIPAMLVVVSAISAIAYPFDLYLPQLQAQGSFFRLFCMEFVKYVGALVLFLVLIESGQSLGNALLAQIGLIASANVLYFLSLCAPRIRFRWGISNLTQLVRLPAARDARTYSFSNMLPASLEHVDKLLVGVVFGLEWLGAYTLAYSMGRFVYNIAKPALYIYYRRFVTEMPGWGILRKVAWSATLFGLCLAAMFWISLSYVPAMDRFASGRWATTILFAGYGLGMVHAIYSQAFALNKDSVAHHSFKAHLIATAASALFLGLALLVPPAPALILLALQYPVRDVLSVLLMDRYRRAARPS